MEFNLELNMKGESEDIVVEENTAAKFGSGSIYVYATPMMIGLMENAALNSVEEALGEEYSTVGINVNVDHISATPLGKRVSAEAILTKIEGKKLYFNVTAYDEDKKIGEGTHTRYIINVKKFLDKLK
ncbi:thioesterase family protein [Clostridium sp. D2Q-11]|uniref:Thioesterase family protein n=1 Tax=Anaeromonas frigoriresistens TaxID=2683708 RepID=A0A942UVH8_9FIRM|nr:thioesterase family protein [Anaeromonas frigoriresistens]MBS4537574.1 thioesterase family protein [Anaeromonas frigoriresistens]